MKIKKRIWVPLAIAGMLFLAIGIVLLGKKRNEDA